MTRSFPALAWACAVWLTGTATALAQPVGTFSWQLQPFCNRVTANVTQNGGVYTLDGHDDQCGAAQRAPLVGLATPNPDGTIGLGISVVTVPGGAPVHVDARITLPGASGPWSDSAGNSGTLVFNGSGAGAARPIPTSGTRWGSVVAAPDGSTTTGLVLRRSSPPFFAVPDSPGLLVEWGPSAATSGRQSAGILATTRSAVAIAGLSDFVAVEGWSSSGRGVRGWTASGTGIEGESGSGTAVAGTSSDGGVGVLAATSSFGGGTALEVRGAIKVSGSVRPAFQHVATSANLSGYLTTLNHPLANGDPDALLFVTRVFTSGSSAAPVTSVWYNSSVGRWTIFHVDSSPMAVGTRFNVLVIKQ